MQPDDLLKLSKEELVEKLWKFNLTYDDAMASMVMIRQEILARFEDQGLSGESIGEYELSKRVRINIKVPIEKARELGATKEQETIDRPKLSSLHKSGVKIEGVTETIYLSVRRIKQEE